MKKIFLTILIPILISCSSDDNTNNASPPTPSVEQQKTIDDVNFYQDLFDREKWYFYNLTGHQIWSLMDIFVIKDMDGDFFKLQIMTYYNQNTTNKSGFYSLRLQKKGEDTFDEISFDASGCGSAFSNPNYEECIKDPLLNAYTYLNLNSLKSWKMTDSDASSNMEWDLGFKGTSIILSDKTNPQTTGGLIYRDSSIYLKNGTPDVKKLQEKIKNKFALESFLNISFN